MDSANSTTPPSRIIKFRAWDRDKSEMVPVMEFNFSQWLVECGTLLKEVVERNSFKNEPTDRHVLMQFTGLTDGNGREIYERDILDFNGVVEFANGSFVLNGWEPLGEMGVDKQAVIGNIYEKPELLKEKNGRRP